MLRKYILLFSISSVFTVAAEASAVVTCSQPGFSQTVYNGTCTVGSSPASRLTYGADSSWSVSRNVFTAQAIAELITAPISSNGSYPLSAAASWVDFFSLPQSNPADVLKITVTGGGLNHTAAIYAGNMTYTGADFCDAHYIGNPACTEEETVSAAGLSFVGLMGVDSISFDSGCGYSNCGVNANADLFELVTVQRFLADGVTPDPFTSTPEPSASALLLLGIPALLVLRSKLSLRKPR